jgi:hypothetical protein
MFEPFCDAVDIDAKAGNDNGVHLTASFAISKLFHSDAMRLSKQTCEFGSRIFIGVKTTARRE